MEVNRVAVGFGIGVLVLATALARDATAQADSSGRCPPGASCATTPTANPSAPRGTQDMRLWSFGDCANRFPYVNSEDHKACVRIVGSDEAKEARAYRVCETSHAGDPAEAAHCKSAFQANKAKAAQDGFVPNAPVQARADASPEVMKKVKAIASAAVERDRAAAVTSDARAEPEPDEPPAVSADNSSEFWSPMTIVGTLSVAILLLGVASLVGRRKQASVAAGR